MSQFFQTDGTKEGTQLHLGAFDEPVKPLGLEWDVRTDGWNVTLSLEARFAPLHTPLGAVSPLPDLRALFVREPKTAQE